MIEPRLPAHLVWQDHAPRLRRRALLTLLGCMAAGHALAQPDSGGYPTRPLRVIVPFLPGGASDTSARTISARLGEALRQPVVVENRPGAGGNIATVAVTRAPADGYQILLGAAYLSVNPNLYKDAGYDPARELELISRLIESRLVVVGRPNLPSLGQLAEQARKTGTPVKLASAGTGTLSHLAGVLILLRLKAPMIHVPYRGSAPAVIDLAGGQVDLMVDSTASAAPMITAARVKAVAVPESARNALFPEVPTLLEQGVPDVNVRAWNAFFVRRSTSPEGVALLRREFERVMATPAIAEDLRAKGLEISDPMSPPQFATRLAAETELWKRTIQEAGITVE